MIELEQSVLIRRPLDEVFALASDPEKDPNWTAVVEHVDATEPLGVGVRLIQRVHLLGRRAHVPVEVLEYVPPVRVVLRANMPHIQVLGWRLFEWTGGHARDVPHAGPARGPVRPHHAHLRPHRPQAPGRGSGSSCGVSWSPLHSADRSRRREGRNDSGPHRALEGVLHQGYPDRWGGSPRPLSARAAQGPPRPGVRRPPREYPGDRVRPRLHPRSTRLVDDLPRPAEVRRQHGQPPHTSPR